MRIDVKSPSVTWNERAGRFLSKFEDFSRSPNVDRTPSEYFPVGYQGGHFGSAVTPDPSKGEGDHSHTANIDEFLR
jgi:hypothetical protein